MKPILEIQNISKLYKINKNASPYTSLRDEIKTFFKTQQKDEFWALKNINFNVTQGESVALIGKNGAGKSTLLKVLSNITAPTQGKIVVRGRIASLLEVGTGFHPELTGRENVFLNGAILGMSQAEVRKNFMDMVDFSGVEKFIDTPIKFYSSGMQLRLAFAVAAFLDPEVLVIDEVLAVGDSEFQKRCMGKMQDISKSGDRTILFVSHNLTAVQQLCNTAVLLEHGELKLHSTTTQVINKYLNEDLDIYTEYNNTTLVGANDFNITQVHLTTNNSNAREFFIENNTAVIVNFNASQPYNDFYIQIALSDINNNLIFETISTPATINKGAHSFTCDFGAHFFNVGKYKITIDAIYNTSVSLLKLDSVILFEMKENEREINWYGEWKGVIRPKFNWQYA